MIEIKPSLPSPLLFPACPCDKVVVEDMFFLGMHTLAKCQCPNSSSRYYHTLPVAHTNGYPIVFSEDGQQAHYAPEAADWLARPLLKAFFQEMSIPVVVRKITYKTYLSVVILNCLDNCYGHMLYKLFHATRYLAEHTDLGLIVLVPRSLLWLVPEGVAEVWWIDVPLRSLHQRLEGLDAFIKEEMKRFRKVYLSEASTQLDRNQVQIAQFTKVNPFPLNQFRALPPTITFVCREDRFWLNSQPDYYLYLAAIKFNFLRYTRWYFVYRQNALIRQTVQRIKEHLPQANFIAVGLGQTGSLGKLVQDARTVGNMSAATERRWCQYYAASHVVIGVHGSGMMIPSATAAAFINLLPQHKLLHLGEDSINSNAHLPFFASRFLPLPASARLVAQHVLDVIQSLTNKSVY